jgi:hypothetical protein
VREIATDPMDSSILYVPTKDPADNPLGNGVFRSIDGGDTWQSLNEGLSNLSIFSIEINPSHPQTLYIYVRREM